MSCLGIGADTLAFGAVDRRCAGLGMGALRLSTGGWGRLCCMERLYTRKNSLGCPFRSLIGLREVFRYEILTLGGGRAVGGITKLNE